MSYTIARSMANWRRDIEKHLTKNTANKLRYMYGGEHVYIPKVHDIEHAVRLVEEDHIAISSASLITGCPIHAIRKALYRKRSKEK